MSPVGAEGKPERLVRPALVDVGLDLVSTGLLVGPHAVEPVGEHVRSIGAEEDHRWEPGTVAERLDVLGDDELADLGTDLRPAVGQQLGDCHRLPSRGPSRLFRRQARRFRSFFVAVAHCG